MPKNDMETSIQKLARIAFERTSKTHAKQQKNNKPARTRAAQNIAKPRTTKPAIAKGAGGRGEAIHKFIINYVIY